MRNPSGLMVFVDGNHNLPNRLAFIRDHNDSWPVRNSGDDPYGISSRIWFRHIDNTDPRAGRVNMLFADGHVESKSFEEVADTYGLWLYE